MPTPFPSLPPERRGALHRRWLCAPRLRGNPWGDPADRDLWVYTPNGYDRGDRRYPAVLALPAYASTGEALLARSLDKEGLAARLDRLIDAGCPPVVVAMPDTLTSLGGSQYVDSPAIGPYASYVLDDVRAEVDAAFRTTGVWGAFGHSSGGFGALHLALSRPGALAAVAAHAPDLGFDLCYLGDFVPALAGLARLGGPEGFPRAFWAQAQAPADTFAALSVLCLSAAYSPEPGRPFPAALPFDPATGAVDRAVLDRWSRTDPVRRVDEPGAAEALRGLRLLYLDCGDRDEHGLQHGARRLVARLRERGVPHLYEEFPGGHRGNAHRFDRSLPLLAAALQEPA